MEVMERKKEKEWGREGVKENGGERRASPIISANFMPVGNGHTHCQYSLCLLRKQSNPNQSKLVFVKRRLKFSEAPLMSRLAQRAKS